MTENDSILLLLPAFLALSMISLPISALFYYYYTIKRNLYVTKNKPDLGKYLSGGDVVGFDNNLNIYQRKMNWLYGDLGEEDGTIKYYKNKLKVSVKIMKIQLALVIVFFTLTILIKP